MKLPPKQTKTLICDVETDALRNYKNLWVAVTYCLETKELRVFDSADAGYIDAFRDYIADCTHWIGHNFLSFDRHVIRHFTGHVIPLSDITDTLLLSRLYNSARDGGHSLERWGKYFKKPKVENEDWSKRTDHMVKRCVIDVEINLLTYNHLLKEGKQVSDFARKIEHEFQELLDDMQEAGFPVDAEGIEQHLQLCIAEQSDIQTAIRNVMKPRAKMLSEVTPRVTKAGGIAKNTKGANAFDNLSIIQGPFTLIEWEEFNIGSPKQVVERMNEYGWKPTVPTKSGKSWKICEENLDTLPDDAPEEAKLITSYLKLKTRIGLMENWLENYNPETKCIHGSVIGIGAVSHRCAHANPNTANIPADTIRKYWRIPEADRCMVGVDAKGIQLRVLGHLTGDQEFIKQVVEGDPHLYNVRMIGPELLPQTTDEETQQARKLAKRFIYAWLLGAGAAKVGSIFGVDTAKGKAISDNYLRQFSALGKLKMWLKQCSAKGWLPTPIGCFIPIASEHYALAMALQGIESEVMKVAGILWKREAEKRKLDAWLIAFVHDEYCINSHKDCAVEAGELMCWAIKRAGEILRLRCPMEGEFFKDGKYTIGRSWYEVH